MTKLITKFRGQDLAQECSDYLGAEHPTGLGFAVHTLAPGQSRVYGGEGEEIALLLLTGSSEVEGLGVVREMQRGHWLTELPWVVHLAPGASVSIRAHTQSRWAVLRTANSKSFASRIYAPEDTQVEHRGQGVLDGACYRHVRLVFDRTIAPPESELVLGEVINFPGRWSSYPPHHHEQPEIYYYEFDPQEGYGHGELGEEVFKIKHQDMLCITGNKDHAQTSAPGYHMYYLWAIRHLPNRPYLGFEFTEPHAKLLL